MSCIPKLFELLQDYAHISAGLMQYLSTEIQIQTVPKGKPLINNPEHLNRIWAVCSGLLKSSYYDASGRNVVSRIWQEGDIILSKNKALFEPGEQIVSIDTSIVLSIDTEKTMHLLQNFKEGHQLARGIYVNDSRQREFRTRLMQISPANAYEQFCQMYPAERMLLQDIASYLNIRPYSLSRIRARRQ